jgi:hypothetical protein
VGIRVVAVVVVCGDRLQETGVYKYKLPSFKIETEQGKGEKSGQNDLMNLEMD